MWNKKGYVIRGSLSGTLRELVDVRTRRILESGFMLYLYEKSHELRVDLLPQYKRSNCSSEIIMMDVNYQQNEEAKLSNIQFKVPSYTFAVMITIGIIALIFEKLT